MMVSAYCKGGDLRNYLNKSINYRFVKKIKKLSQIARGLLDIHNAEKVHKDFHSGNILFSRGLVLISDLGLCQPANNDKQSVKKEFMEYCLMWHQKFYVDLNIQKQHLLIWYNNK